MLFFLGEMKILNSFLSRKYGEIKFIYVSKFFSTLSFNHHQRCTELNYSSPNELVDAWRWKLQMELPVKTTLSLRKWVMFYSKIINVLMLDCATISTPKKFQQQYLISLPSHCILPHFITDDKHTILQSFDFQKGFYLCIVNMPQRMSQVLKMKIKKTIG